MKELGSEYHSCTYPLLASKRDTDQLRLLANGRQAIEVLIRTNHWKRIWIPAYFCYEVIDYLRERTGIDICLYDDYPLLSNDEDVTQSLSFEQGDVLLRMNYFGMRTFHSSKDYPVPVIEDHTHGLTTQWAINSDADWCIASLRKTLPVAAGGIFWSPAQHTLPEIAPSSASCEKMADMRYRAMELKTDYLVHGVDKQLFRDLFAQSETLLEQLDICGMDRHSAAIFQTIDITQWMKLRKTNWQIAKTILGNRVLDVTPDAPPFSIVLKCATDEERKQLKTYLVTHQIYPAILWDMPTSSDYQEAYHWSTRLLSLHCDARYNTKDMDYLAKTILAFYD